MNQDPVLPYELHLQGGGGFVSFETDETVAFPLFSLGQATLRGAGGRVMALEFSHHRVVVDGQSLGELFIHLLAGRVRLIRCGRTADCVVSNVQIMDS
jgi:hypothetical protein